MKFIKEYLSILLVVCVIVSWLILDIRTLSELNAVKVENFELKYENRSLKLKLGWTDYKGHLIPPPPKNIR